MFNRYPFSLTAVLLLVLALPFAGCDLLGIGSSISSEDLEDIRDEFECEEVDVLSDSESISGEINESDCEDEDFFYDVLAFELEEEADVEIEAESEDFDLIFCLFDINGNDIACEFAFEGEGEATIDVSDLDDGVYAILIGPDGDDVFGDYQLSVRSDV